MKKDLLVIVGQDSEPAAVARSAMAKAFPDSTILICSTHVDGLALPEGTGVEIMVLLDPALGTADAIAARTKSRLPRWAVVSRGGDAGPEATAVDAALWNLDFLAVVFSLAWSRLAARRENEIFRGDLKAIGTRFAHDLRSPLGGILSTAEALGETLRASAPEEAARTQRIVESQDEILQLVRTLSSLASAFTAPVQRLAFNMADPAGAALQRFEPKLLYRGDSVRAPESWPAVEGDERKTELIWTMLLQNVLKHTAAGRKVTINWRPEGADILFTVADDGPGVPEDRRPLLFWPFHLLHEPQAARGFGLPIVERLVGLQGGHCLFEPASGGGSVFGFTLPKSANL